MSDTSITALLTHLGTHAKSVEVINPNNGKAAFVLPQFSSAEVFAAVAAAKVMAPTWAATPVKQRANILLNLHDLMLKNQEQFLDLLQFETGKSRGHAFEDFAGALNSARYYGKQAPKQLGLKRVRSGAPTLTKNYLEHVPVGVVGVITPWNYPLALTGLDVLPALVAGNPVVHKIDNQTALTALFLRKLAIDAGLPSEVWTIVVGDGAEVGNAISDSVDYVAFTGSTATGRIVAQRAAARLIGYSLELGGKNPMVVLPGANISEAARIAVAGAVGNTGQLCVAVERIYVPNDVKAEFTAALEFAVGALSIGKSAEYAVDLGTLTSAAQVKRVTGMLADAAEKGAKVFGGEQRTELGPYFVTPAIVTNVPEDSTLNRSEVFGPVLQVYGYATVAEAIVAANDTEFGLNASVVGPEREALEVARQLNAGSVNINEGFRASFASMDSPMGGFKNSGHGRRNGVYGLTRFTEPKAIGVAGGLLGWALKLPSRGAEYKRVSKLLVILSKTLRILP